MADQNEERRQLISVFLQVAATETLAKACELLEKDNWNLQLAVRHYFEFEDQKVETGGSSSGVKDEVWTDIRSRGFKCSVFLDVDTVELVPGEVANLYQKIESALKNRTVELEIDFPIKCYGIKETDKIDAVRKLKNYKQYRLREFDQRLPAHSDCKKKLNAPYICKTPLCQIEFSTDIGVAAVKNRNHILIISSDPDIETYYRELKGLRMSSDGDNSRIYLATDEPGIVGDGDIWQWSAMRAGGPPAAP